MSRIKIIVIIASAVVIVPTSIFLTKGILDNRQKKAESTLIEQKKVDAEIEAMVKKDYIEHLRKMFKVESGNILALHKSDIKKCLKSMQILGKSISGDSMQIKTNIMHTKSYGTTGSITSRLTGAAIQGQDSGGTDYADEPCPVYPLDYYSDVTTVNFYYKKYDTGWHLENVELLNGGGVSVAKSALDAFNVRLRGY